MVMRLLTKKDINQTNAIKRTQEIDEGKKLARRIDALRETLLNEESALEKFRCETIKNIQLEIEQFDQKKTELIKEVEELSIKREELLAPLTSEWGLVNKAKADLEKKEVELTELLIATETLRIDAEVQLKEAKRTNARAETCEEVAQKKLEGAIISEREAKALLVKAQKTKKDADNYKQATTLFVQSEQEKIDALLVFIQAKEKDIQEREVKLEQGFVLLRDRENMLERDIKRLKNKK